MEKSKIKSKKDILFVGDDLETDIKGGLENKIDTCWCNYDNKINNKYYSKYEIKELQDLISIL